MIVEIDPAAMIVTKRADTGGDQARLRREAAVLDAARHPGVTELLGTGAGTGPPGLHLRALPGRPLAELGELSDREAAGLGAAVATTLADLHDIGVVHGAVSADHVLVGPDGRPVLCSFGRGGSGGDIDRPDPAGDVAALAAVLESRLRPAGTVEADREHRALRRTLACAAHRDARRRPSARRLAAMLVDRVPGAALPSGAAPAAASPAPPPGREPGRRVGRRRLAGRTPALALVALLVTGAVLVLLRPWTGHQSRSGPGRVAGVLTTGTGRYRIGEPTDRVVTGRWRCQEALPALLRPATGEVWVFDGWAAPGHPIRARLIARVDRAVSLAVIGGAVCDGLSVTRQTGPPVRVDPIAAP